LIGWFIFPLIFVLFSYHQFSLMELIRLTIKVMFAGATFGAFSGYLVATRLKH
jgi:hypothetical protein